MNTLPEYFLSPINPTATNDQRDLKAFALRVTDTAEMVAARKNIDFQWRAVAGQNFSAQAWDIRRHDPEYLFANMLKAVNSDANYLKLVRNFYGPPHEWFGMKVPGTCIGGGAPTAACRAPRELFTRVTSIDELV